MCFECIAIRLLQEVVVLKNAVWGFPGGLWPRILLAMQGILVRSLVGKDSTCSGATKLMGHNYPYDNSILFLQCVSTVEQWLLCLGSPAGGIRRGTKWKTFAAYNVLLLLLL